MRKLLASLLLCAATFAVAQSAPKVDGIVGTIPMTVTDLAPVTIHYPGGGTENVWRLVASPHNNQSSLGEPPLPFMRASVVLLYHLPPVDDNGNLVAIGDAVNVSIDIPAK